MFTKALTYKNTTGSWASIEEAVTQINAEMHATTTESDIVSLNELRASKDMVELTPTLSEDGTIIVIVKQVTQAALDVFDGLTEGPSEMLESSSITKTVSEWTPVGE